MFWSLNCNMNGHHLKHFSVDIAFYKYNVPMKKESMISSVVKNSWNWNFANFWDLVLILPPEVFYKRDVLKNFTIFTGKHLCQSVFLSWNSIRKCEFCKIFKSTFFTVGTDFILQQLLALYFAIMYNWQLLYIAGNF